MIRLIAQLIGLALVIVGLTDVYLTVLYARSGVGFISRFLIPAVWRFFRAAGGLIPRTSWADLWLAFCGPTMIVLLVGVWVWMLIIGFGLMFWRCMGVSIVSTQGVSQTATTLPAAIALAGDSLSTVGNAEMVATSNYARFLMLLASIIGLCMITLLLAFLVEIYNALLRRNKFALTLEFSTDRTGDAARLLAALGAGDDFGNAKQELSKMADELIDLYESHHFYSALLYFRFREPYYALSRVLLVVMDAASLIHTALDDRRHGAFKQCAAMLQLHHGAMHMLKDLSRAFLPHGGPPPDAGRQTGAIVTAQWRRQFEAGVDRLKLAGISVTGDRDGAARRYAELRRQWDPFIVAFASYMAHPLDQVDTAGSELAHSA